MATAEQGSNIEALDAALGRGVAPDSRSGRRYPMTVAVRVGWIDDEKRMSYSVAEGVDISELGLAVRMAHRLRLSALVHLELAGSGMSAVARVRNCVRSGGAWRVGLEVTSAFPSDRGEAGGSFDATDTAVTQIAGRRPSVFK